MTDSANFILTDRAWTRRRARFARRYAPSVVDAGAGVLTVVDGLAGLPGYDAPDAVTRTLGPDPAVRVVSCAGRPLAARVGALQAEVGAGPSLWLAAANGAPPLPLDAVRRILADRRSGAEMLIALDLDALCATADIAFAASDDRWATEAASKSEAYITNLVGTRTWKAYYPARSTPARRAAVLLEHYAAALRGCGATVACCAIRFRREPVRQCLLFCTREPDHVPAANDALRDVEDGLLRDASTEDTLSLFDEPLDVTRYLVPKRCANLADRLAAEVPAGWTCLRDVRRRFTLSHFGEFDKPDYLAAIEALTHSGAWRTTHGGTCRDDDDPLLASAPGQPEKAP